eukprot:COSAG01_NODE_55_length_31115_cov_105.202533_8_plen_210_part_00
MLLCQEPRARPRDDARPRPCCGGAVARHEAKRAEHCTRRTAQRHWVRHWQRPEGGRVRRARFWHRCRRGRLHRQPHAQIRSSRLDCGVGLHRVPLLLLLLLLPLLLRAASPLGQLAVVGLVAARVSELLSQRAVLAADPPISPPKRGLAGQQLGDAQLSLLQRTAQLARYRSVIVACWGPACMTCQELVTPPRPPLPSPMYHGASVAAV